MAPVFVFFSYLKDAESVEQACRFVRQNLEYEAEIWVFDDAHHPMPAEWPGKVLVNQVVPTYFARGGNLVGRPAIMGMLTCMLQALEMSGASHVVKLDCDTAMIGTDWMNSGKRHGCWDLLGVSFGTCTLNGPFYCMRRRFIRQMLFDATTLPHVGPTEDIAMAQLMQRAGGVLRILGARDCLLNSFDFKQDLSIERYRRTRFLTFGQRFQMREFPGDPHHVQANAMRMFFDNMYSVERQATPWDILKILRGEKTGPRASRRRRHLATDQR